MSTFMAKKGQVPQRWFLFDATDQVVGRLAVQIATILRGKHKPNFQYNCDCGDFVVIINADANATHQSVIHVMEAARVAGLIHLTFATQSSAK